MCGFSKRWRSRTLRIFLDSAYLLCSAKVTHHHTGAVALLTAGNRAARPPGPPVKTNWFGKNERVTKEQKHGGGDCSFLPTGKRWTNRVLRVGRFK